MKICIIHFASSLFRILLAKIFDQEFFYRVLLVLSRCCFHQHCREFNSLQKKIYIRPILFSENIIIRSVVGGKVNSQILFGARSETPKILFGARGEKRKNVFGAKGQLRKIVFASQRVKICFL